MTQTLKKQLTVLCVVSLCGGALLWNSGVLRAQNYSDAETTKIITRKMPPKLTRDEAAKIFVDLLNAMPHNSGNSYLNTMRFLVAVSPKTERQLGRGQNALMTTLIRQWHQPGQSNQTVRVQNESDKTATVVVENNKTLPARPLVLIEENGGWGVDVVETYAKWNNLQGVPKLQAIYKLTGVMLEGLPRTEEIKRSECQTNLKQIALGIAQYAADYDEKLPPAKSWSDGLQPYVQKEALFNCPARPKGKSNGYAYNSKLSNKSGFILTDTSKTVTVYETTVLKRNAYGLGENLAFRHQNGANFAFADGHVEWFPKTQVPSFKLKP